MSDRRALQKRGRKHYREWEVKRVRTTCPHCATGCQYDLLVKGNKIVDVEAADGPSATAGCCASRAAPEVLISYMSGDRLTISSD